MTQADKLREFLQALLELKRRMREPPKGYNYHGSEDYVLDRGILFESKPLTKREREIVLSAVDNWGRRFQMKQCFYNAQMLLFYDKAEKLRYVEGYAQGPAGMPVLHAWLTINHKVVDLTWRKEKFKRPKGGRLPDRILGTIPEGWAYYGVIMSRRKVIERIFDTEMSQSHLEDWLFGFPLFKQKRIHPVEDLLE